MVVLVTFVAAQQPSQTQEHRTGHNEQGEMQNGACFRAVAIGVREFFEQRIEGQRDPECQQVNTPLKAALDRNNKG